MGRDTSIYMFDKEKATANLYEHLQHKIYHTKTFKDYIKNRQEEINSSYNISIDKILETVRNDINMITPDELFEIILFF